MAKKRTRQPAAPSAQDAGDIAKPRKLGAMSRDELTPERLDSVVSQLHAQFAAQSGGAVLTPAQQQNRMGGILLPSLAARWVFAQNTLPLGTTLTLSGLHFSCKTALSIEMARWVVSQPGMAFYNDVERKFSGDLISGTMFHRPELVDRVRPVPAATQNDWHKAVFDQVTLAKETAETIGFDVIPVISIVDSLAAAQPLEVETKFESAGGTVNRSYSEIALNNARWFQSIPSRVAEAPFLLLLIQHSKEVKVENMPYLPAQRVQKGGAEAQFVKTTGLELTGTKNFGSSRNPTGRAIQIKCTKNAFGPSNRVVTVDYHWPWAQVQLPDGQITSGQYMWWDWHGATIKLLMELAEDRSLVRQSDAINSIVDLHKKPGGRAWSNALGVSSSDAMPISELGERLEYEFPHLVAQLYDVLTIAVRPVMVPRTPLSDVWNGLVPRTPVLSSWLPRGWRVDAGAAVDDE